MNRRTSRASLVFPIVLALVAVCGGPAAAKMDAPELEQFRSFVEEQMG